MEPVTVCEPLKHLEKVLGKGQEEIYQPLPCLMTPDGRRVTRWKFSAEEILQINEGGQLLLCVETFGEPFQPVRLEIAPLGPLGDQKVVEALS